MNTLPYDFINVKSLFQKACEYCRKL